MTSQYLAFLPIIFAFCLICPPANAVDYTPHAHLSEPEVWVVAHPGENVKMYFTVTNISAEPTCIINTGMGYYTASYPMYQNYPEPSCNNAWQRRPLAVGESLLIPYWEVTVPTNAGLGTTYDFAVGMASNIAAHNNYWTWHDASWQVTDTHNRGQASLLGESVYHITVIPEVSLPRYLVRISDLHYTPTPPNPIKVCGRIISESPLKISDGRASVQISGVTANLGEFMVLIGDWNGSVLTVSHAETLDTTQFFFRRVVLRKRISVNASASSEQHRPS